MGRTDEARSPPHRQKSWHQARRTTVELTYLDIRFWPDAAIPHPEFPTHLDSAYCQKAEVHLPLRPRVVNDPYRALRFVQC